MKKKYLGLFLIGIVIIGGLVFYLSQQTKEDLSLVEDIDYAFDGYDGQGMITLKGLQLDEKVVGQDFISACSLEASKTQQLSNGDSIVITVIYDGDLASKYNVNIIQNEKTITVSGLIEEYQSAKDLPKDLCERYQTVGKIIVEKEFDKVGYKDIEVTYDSTYFQSHKKRDTHNDHLIVVYKIEGKSKGLLTTYKSFTQYFYVEFSNVNSAYKDSQTGTKSNQLYDDSYAPITSSSQVEASVKKIFQKDEYNEIERVQ